MSTAQSTHNTQQSYKCQMQPKCEFIIFEKHQNVYDYKNYNETLSLNLEILLS